MAWEDRTPFEAIEVQFGLKQGEVIDLMRQELSENAWKLWRKRMNERKTKHLSKRITVTERHKCNRQRSISHNKISKR
jgi:uncharacterized protein (TIGR03643 family)